MGFSVQRLDVGGGTRGRTASAFAAVLGTLSGCGPEVRVPGGDGSASGGQTPMGTDSGSIGSTGGSTTSEVPCPDGDYCFERIDLREIGTPSQMAAGNLDGEPGFEVCGWSRPFDSSGSLPPEAWAIDWIEGRPRTLLLEGPEIGQVGGPAFVAPSPIDGVIQCFAFGGAYVIEDGSLVIREYPRPSIEGLPPMLMGLAGPVDVDGDGRHEMVAYEASSNIYGYTGHLVRYEGDQSIVIGMPLPAEKSWSNQLPGYLAIAAADFDGDGRDEIIAFDDLDTSVGAPDTYDPALNHVVTLRVTGDGSGYDELWRAPAGTFATELSLHDLNGDGELDLLVGGEGGVAIAAGLGGGTFEEPKLLDLSPYGTEGTQWVYGVAPGDLDGDGRLELVATLSSGATDNRIGDVVVIERPLDAPMMRTLAMDLVQAGGYAEGSAKVAVADLDDNGCDDVLTVAKGAEGEKGFLVVLAFHR